MNLLLREEFPAVEPQVINLGNKAIANRLGVTVVLVKWHLQHIFGKLHVHSRTEAALQFRQGQTGEN